MGYSNGTYTRNHNFSADASVGIKILATRFDTEIDDVASALTNVVWTRDGNTTPTVDIPMGGHKFVGAAAATSVSNYMRVREFIENIPIFMNDVESSADRVSVSAQYFTSVSANQAPGDATRIFVRAKSNKSSAVLYLNGHSANIEYQDGNRIGPAMVSGGVYEVIYSSVDTAWKIQNPDDGRTDAERTAGVTPTNFRYPELDIRRYGPDGTVAGDTAAFQRAVSVVDALNGGEIVLGATTYYLGVVGELPFGTNFRGTGNSTVLMKSTASSVFTVKAFNVQFRDMLFDADVATSTTYGTSGAMIDHAAGFNSAFGKLINVDTQNIDTVIQFASDAGQYHQVIGGNWEAYTLTAGSEGLIYRTGVGGSDTGAAFRKIGDAVLIGEIDQRGAFDSQIQGVDTRRVRMDSDTTLLCVMGGRWGSLGSAITADGESTRIMGVAIAGDVTLAATMSGSCVWKGNIQSAGTFTDNTAVNVCEVEHHPLSVTYTHIKKHTLTSVNSAEEIQTRRVGGNQGDADVIVALDSTPTIIPFNSAITADRAVTLPASGRPGYTYRVMRQAGATGAFNINVGTGPLKALASASTWCEVTWSGPSGAWILTAAGSL
jgi:hypothetical protein